MNLLRLSTATTLLVGPIVDSVDATAETGLTLSQADILLWKEGGTTLAQKNDATSATHRSNGMYTVPVNTTDTNTLGMLVVNIAESGTMVYKKEYTVVPAVVYDALVLGTDLLDVSMTQILGTAVATPATAGLLDVNVKQISTDATAADNAELFFDGTGYAGGTTKLDVNAVALSGDTTAADNLEAAYDGAGYAGGTIPQQVVLTTSGRAAVADDVLDEALSGHVAAGSLGAALYIIRSNTAQAGDGTHITLDASASAVNDFYNNQMIHIVAGTGVGQGRIIVDYVGATKVAEVAAWATNPSSDSVFVIRPFGSIPGASAPTASEVADAVWDEPMAGHATEATYGALFLSMGLQVGTAQAGAGSSITLDATGVPASSATNDAYKYQLITIRAGTGIGQTRQITAYNGTTKVATVNLAWTVNPSSDSEYVIHPGGLDAATVAQVATGVWAATRAGNATAGSFGEYVNADVLRLSGDATAADNAEAFFDGTGYAGTNNVIPTVTTLTGHTVQTGDAFARLGAPAGASVSADVAAVKVDTAAVKAKTDNLPSDPADASVVAGLIAAVDAKIDTIDSIVDAILADTGTDGVVVAAGSKTGYALSAGGVDAILDDPITEPSGVFAWGSATPRNILGWLGAMSSNKITQTTTTQTVRNRADGATLATATCSDDATTAVKGSMS